MKTGVVRVQAGIAGTFFTPAPFLASSCWSTFISARSSTERLFENGNWLLSVAVCATWRTASAHRMSFRGGCMGAGDLPAAEWLFCAFSVLRNITHVFCLSTWTMALPRPNAFSYSRRGLSLPIQQGAGSAWLAAFGIACSMKARELPSILTIIGR